MAANDTNQGLVGKMHKAFGVEKLSNPDKPDEAVANLRKKLIDEEAWEVYVELDAVNVGDGSSFDRTKLAKELADLLVVAYGAAEVFDIDLDWAFRETMDSNMTKLGSDGKPVMREDGKFLKGPNYRPPNTDLVVYGTTRPYQKG